MFPDVTPQRTLVGIEFAGHHGFTFARDLARRGYRIVTVLPSATKRLKDVGTNRTRKSDDIDAWQICKLVRISREVGHPFHSMSDRRFTRCRTPVSLQVGQVFH